MGDLRAGSDTLYRVPFRD